MRPPLPPEIRVESSRQGPRYLLPPRDTGPLKVVALGLIGFGCLFGGFAVVWILGVLGVSQKDGFQIGGLLFGLFGVPFLLAGLAVVGLGVIGFCGRCEIEIQSGELVVRERGGPFRWTRRIPIKNIRRFALAGDSVQINDQPVRSGPLSDVGVLAAEVGTLKPRLVLLGYPRGLTEALAARLTADVAAQTGAAPLAIRTAANEQVYYRQESDLLPGEVPGPPTKVLVHGDLLAPPAGTNIRLTGQAGGLVGLIPPQGFRTARGLLYFAIAWLSLIVVFAVLVGHASGGRGWGRGEGAVTFFVVMGVFGTIGIVLLVAAVNRMRRKASIRASGTELIIVQRSLFGTETFNRSVTDLETIGMGDSGIVVNGVPVQELRIYDKGGAGHGFFSHLSNDELLWLATRLRHATGVGERPAGSSAQETPNRQDRR